MPEKGEPGFGKIQFAVDVRIHPLFDLPGCGTGKNDGPEEQQQEDTTEGEAGVFDEAKEDFFHVLFSAANCRSNCKKLIVFFSKTTFAPTHIDRHRYWR
jgi:hypothetical protein